MVEVLWLWDGVLEDTSPLVYQGKEQLAGLILEEFSSWRNITATTRAFTQRLNANNIFTANNIKCNLKLIN